jgi:hypothetical protein
VSIGASYFGNRIVRHVAEDMHDLAERGFTGVLHTFSENDLAFYREAMAKIVEVSQDAGLEVQIDPWGVGGVFGGEAESRFVPRNPGSCQKHDGLIVSAACPNAPAFRSFVGSWTDAAIDTGADRVFWDEPHWVVPVCGCHACSTIYSERYGETIPTEPTAQVMEFREESLVDFLRDVVGYVHTKGGRSTVCLLPHDGDWKAVAELPGLDTLATDPYWAAFGRPVKEFVHEYSVKVKDLADEHGVGAQIWIQGFGLGPEDADDIRTAVETARAAGVDDLWTWGYEACGHMPALKTRAPEKVWDVLTEALTGRSEPSN